MSKLEEIKQRLDDQANATQSARDEQEAADLLALFEAREEFGVDAVQAIRIPYEPGLPMHAIVRRPKPIEFKRFQDQVAKKDAGTAEAIKAGEQIAAVCRVYPAPDKGEGDALFEKMCAACPGLKVAMGASATGLASAKAREDSKT